MARDRKSRGWLSSLLGGSEDPPGTRYELTVIDGADAGARYRIDQPQIQIGRRVPGSTPGSGIELNDKSVSGRHAIIGWEDGKVTIEHLPSATNPTLVNGRKVTRRRVRDGDRIVLGLVVLELRARRSEPVLETAPSPPEGLSARSETDPVNARAELVLREGVDDLVGARFPLVQRRTAIGRDEDCEISLDVPSISRNHAALVWDDEQLVLIHESAVNPTQVNGMQVRDRRRVFQGDEIRLSERVAFEVMLEASETPGTQEPDAYAEQATQLTSPPGAAAEAADATRVTPLPATPDDADATRVTPLPASADDAEATRVTPLPTPAEDELAPARERAQEPGPRPDDVDATRIYRLPELEGESGAPDGDADATRVTPLPEPARPTTDDADPGATRVMPAAQSGTVREDADPDATRIDPVPGQESAGESDDPDTTRTAPTPAEGSEEAPAHGQPGVDPGRFAAGDATQIAPAPERSRYADADVTRIAPIPAGAEREAPRSGDADATLVRPPLADPSGEAADEDAEQDDTTRVADPDPELAEDPDEARTLIRRSPYADAERTIVRSPDEPDDDAAATVIRPAPTRKRPPSPAETVILESDDEEEEDERP